MERKKWGSVAVFISSTFQDMHGERDYLVKEVFPDLQAWCEKRKLHLYDIDLRWGVTAEDTESRNTVSACLHNIDNCRPFFLCLLAQRRGWVPSPEEVSRATLEEYPDISSYMGKNSVTEMEIEHALLAPMKRLYEGALRKQEPCRYALFLFRDDEYLRDVPEEQRKVYLDGEENLEKVRAFRDVIREGGYPTVDYHCEYDPKKKRLTAFSAEGRELKTLILRHLQEQIRSAFPERFDDEENGESAAFEEEFIWRDEHSYYPQRADLEFIRKDLASDVRTACLITGPGGSGKTSLLCAALREFRGKQRLLVRFCGMSPDTGDLYSLLCGLLEECGIPRPASERELTRNLEQYLGETVSEEGTVILIDALNQCRDGLRLLELLPRELPRGLKIILSCKSESLSEELMNRIRAYRNVRICPLRTECDEAFKRGMIDQFLSQYMKRLDEENIALIACRKEINTPLMVSLILSELRIFGRFEDLQSEILKYSGSIRSAFGQVLARMEQESPRCGELPLSTAVFGFIAASRDGLNEEELITAVHLLTGEESEHLQPEIRLLLRQIRPFLTRKEDRYDLFHESFRLASAERYSDLSGRLNENLAETFRRFADPTGDLSWSCPAERPFTELPWHLFSGGKEEALSELLLQPQYIRRKISVCGIQELLDDYALSRDADCQSVGGALRLAAEQLSRDPSQLSFQLRGRLYDLQASSPKITELLDNLEENRDTYQLLPCNNALASPEESRMILRFGTEAVTAMCLHMRSIAVADELNRIGLIDPETGILQRIIQVPGSPVRCMASDGNILYTGHANGTLCRWHTQSGSRIEETAVCKAPINALSVSEGKIHIANEAGEVLTLDCAEMKQISSVRISGRPVLCVAADGGTIACGGMDMKMTVLKEGKSSSLKTGCGYTGRAAVNGDHVIFSTFYPRIFFRNLTTGKELRTDYTDGYDFVFENNEIMDQAREEGPYIRDLILFGDTAAIATPFSVALFPAEGAEKALESWHCRDVRALAAAGEYLFAGTGNGMVYCFRRGMKQKEAAPAVMPVSSVVLNGETAAVLTGCSADFYHFRTHGEEIRLRKSSESRTTDNLGYYRHAVPWKSGFGISTFCHVNEWFDTEDEKWFTLYQSMKLQPGIDTTPSGAGAVATASSENCMLTLDQEGTFHGHWCRGDMDRTLLGKTSQYGWFLSRSGIEHAKGLTGFSNDRFAVWAEDSPVVSLFRCDERKMTMYGTLEAPDPVAFVKTAEDGHLIVITKQGKIIGAHPDGDRVLYRYSLPLKIHTLAAADGRLFLAAAGRKLVILREWDGHLLFSIDADAEITAVTATDGWIWCGTENGRLMILREKNRDCPPSEAVSPVRTGKMPDRPGRTAAKETPQKPVPVIRRIPPKQDGKAFAFFRAGCAFLPLILITVCMIAKDGWGAFLTASSHGAETGSVLSWIGGIGLELGRFMILAVMSLLVMAADVTDTDAGRWMREYADRFLNRIAMPALLVSVSIPCLKLLHAGREAAEAALTLSCLVPAGMILVYYVFISANLHEALARKASARNPQSADQIAMHQKMKHIRILAAGILFAALLCWTLILFLGG